MKWFALWSVLLCGCVCWSGEGEMPRPVVAELLKQDFTKDAGTEGRVLTVTFAPGGGSPAHKHPGAIFAYVLEGSVVSGLNEDEAKTYKAGECWYEHPGCVHRVSKNTSATEPAKLLVFFVTQAGQPIVIPVK